ncbi:aminopeptidase N C-terminal domain-containing protein [Synechococcus sp. HJ21-Hayes]|nr:aminopeptidase N C-terminal domain-containing protein [Synechococcus sp. HJ21-Hayes]
MDAAVDQCNPIIAFRMARVFSRWQNYGPKRSLRIREILDQLMLAS